MEVEQKNQMDCRLQPRSQGSRDKQDGEDERASKTARSGAGKAPAPALCHHRHKEKEAVVSGIGIETEGLPASHEDEIERTTAWARRSPTCRSSP